MGSIFLRDLIGNGLNFFARSNWEWAQLFCEVSLGMGPIFLRDLIGDGIDFCVGAKCVGAGKKLDSGRVSTGSGAFF